MYRWCEIWSWCCKYSIIPTTSKLKKKIHLGHSYYCWFVAILLWLSLPPFSGCFFALLKSLFPYSCHKISPGHMDVNQWLLIPQFEVPSDKSNSECLKITPSSFCTEDTLRIMLNMLPRYMAVTYSLSVYSQGKLMSWLCNIFFPYIQSVPVKNVIAPW